MKKLIVTLLCILPVVVFASGGGVHLESANVDLGNKASMQRGAKYYVNYCMACHSLQFSRYNRVAKDLDLTDNQVFDHYIFTTDEKGEKSKVGSLMTNAMSKNYGKAAFGAPPPDLSLVSRSRGADWIYTYLKSFYLDKTRPVGVNNLAFPDVGMPHVLWELQGWQTMKAADSHDGGDGHGETKSDAADEHHVPSLADLELTEQGSLSPVEYAQVVKDLTNFLVYVGEPSQLIRKKLSIYVMLFLALFVFVTYLLKKEYWKDVH